MENKETEFKPCWGVMFCYFRNSGFNSGFANSIYSLNNQTDFNNKPEITSLIINQIQNRIYKTGVILNMQIIWINEPFEK